MFHPIEKLKIFYPLEQGKENPILRTKSEKISEIDEEIKEFAEILMEMMREYDGVGLAAPQIGKNLAMIATTQWKKMPTWKHADKDYLGETLLINPKIIGHSQETQISEEACLSLPGEQGKVERYEWIIVKFKDIKGKEKQQKYSGFNACILQHEIDHLNGILFTDKLITSS